MFKQYSTALLLLFAMLTACSSGQKSEFESEVISFRKEKNRMFANPSNSPLTKEDRKNFVSLNYYPPDSTFLVRADIIQPDSVKVINMSTSTGKPVKYQRVAVLEFPLGREEHQLTAFKEVENETDRWFIPFTDETSGEETYGGGRYVEVKPDTEKGYVKLDFNKAYNPYCHYNPDYTCPIPPLENDLAAEIHAGEKKFKEL